MEIVTDQLLAIPARTPVVYVSASVRELKVGVISDHLTVGCYTGKARNARLMRVQSPKLLANSPPPSR